MIKHYMHNFYMNYLAYQLELVLKRTRPRLQHKK